MCGSLNRSEVRPKFALADRAGHLGLAHSVVRRQMDLASQMNRLTVVLTDKQPDRIEVARVGLDSPVTSDLRAEALAVHARTAGRDLEDEIDPLLTDRPEKPFLGADKFDGSHPSNSNHLSARDDLQW